MKSRILDLIRRCAVELPPDVEEALRGAAARESRGSAAAWCLETLLENLRKARAGRVPLCQDTGLPLFFVHFPDGVPLLPVKEAIREAVRAATEEGILRPNCVEILSGRNTNDNTGERMPLVKCEPWEREELRIRLLLKGGGSENVSGQYSLPDPETGAERDLEGVRRVVLRHLSEIQGLGCPPGVVGLGIGGDRESSYAVAKEQLFRPLGDVNPCGDLRDLEERLTQEINALGIGPMGLGGAATVLGVKAGVAERHPACYFVTVSYLCWAVRRGEISFSPAGEEIGG